MNAAVLSAVSSAADLAPIIVQSAVEFLTGKLIESAGSDKAAQLAKAKVIEEIAGALQAINAGSAAGVAELQTGFLALTKATSDPANSLIFNGLLATLATELEAKVSSGLLGKANAVIVDGVLGWITTTCQAYITAYGAAE